MTITRTALARRIDHTRLLPETTPSQIDALCDEALEHGFYAVCVNPRYVRRASDRLAAAPRSTDHQRPLVVSVVGFPLGASTTATKVDEAHRAMYDGALEIDMVASLGALVTGDRAAVRSDIEAVARVVHGASEGAILKVILETAALTIEQIILGCRCCGEGEADFVKTSTGFHPRGGATIEQVQRLHRTASPLRVKASGGIRTTEAACAMLEAGAERLGTSASVAIVQGLPQ